MFEGIPKQRNTISLFQIYEAIQLVDEEMLKERRIKPDPYVFTCLLSGLARVGYTKKAFKVFNQVSVNIQTLLTLSLRVTRYNVDEYFNNPSKHVALVRRL